MACGCLQKAGRSNPAKLGDTLDDSDGSGTLKALQKTKSLVERVTGNAPGSLGLHPAIYFYGPSGRHSSYMFMGTMELVAKKAVNNDAQFLKTFTKVRRDLEKILIEKKDLLSTIIQRHISGRRTSIHATVLEFIVKKLRDGVVPTDADLVSVANLEGKIVVGTQATTGTEFSDDVKSKAFIASAISSAQRCTICEGYLDPTKSVSYDHVKDKKFGGVGDVGNCGMTHPYCNTGFKNGGI